MRYALRVGPLYFSTVYPLLRDYDWYIYFWVTVSVRGMQGQHFIEAWLTPGYTEGQGSQLCHPP